MTDDRHDDPDIRLMLRVKDGDEAAFGELVDRYGGVLVNFMYRFLGSRMAGEELAQEVFMKVWRAAPRYEPKARFKTWLLTIATNVCLNRKRWESKRLLLSLESGQENEGDAAANRIPGRENGPAELSETEELKERVRDAIAQLPEQQRAALIMSRYDQMPYVDIAESLDLSVMAVKSLLNRAKDNLRKRLEKDLRDWLPQDAVQRDSS